MDNCIFPSVTEKIRKLGVLFLVQRNKTIDIWILFTTSETLFEKMSPLKKDKVLFGWKTSDVFTFAVCAQRINTGQWSANSFNGNSSLNDKP